MKLFFLPFFFLFLMDPRPTVETVIAADLDYLADFYKERHQNPEISLEEKETSKALASELRKAGFEVTENFGGYGIVSIYENGDGPTVLYRTDMDALPMYEKTNLPYASSVEVSYNGETTGTMHSCGHDMHMTAFLGTARAMVAMKDQWKGRLMFIGQPAEEIGQGARLMLNNGLYNTFGVPDAGIGLHCNPTIPSGQIGLREGFSMANTESVDIKVFGIGAHGASPHMSIDPVVLASMIVMDLQTIVSRNLKPIESAVITVGSFKSGTKHNIIPDEAHLKLTIRTYKEEVRQMIHKRIGEICRGVGIAAGLPEDKLPEVTIPDSFTPANYNDPALTGYIIKTAGEAIGTENVLDAEPQMVGEDFACYGSTEHDVPTVLYWLGTVPDERLGMEQLPGLHSPFYYPKVKQTIQTAIKVNTKTMISLMNEK
jgi:hippurate hydrolase